MLRIAPQDEVPAMARHIIGGVETSQVLGYRFRSFFRGRTSLDGSGPEFRSVGGNLI